MTFSEGSALLHVPHEELLAGLVRQGIDHERAEAIVHALVDIGESMGKIYGTLLPELMAVLDLSSAEFKDKLWDIREEFRHVEYHLQDAQLTDL
jgi:hypothetical protein